MRPHLYNCRSNRFDATFNIEDGVTFWHPIIINSLLKLNNVLLLTSLLIVMSVNILYRLLKYSANIMSGVSRFTTSFYFVSHCD